MKMRILISLAILGMLSATAFGYQHWRKPAVSIQKKAACQPAESQNAFMKAIYDQAAPELYFSVKSRFNATISKEDLHNATSILDIFPSKATESRSGYHLIRLGLLKDKEEIVEIGDGKILNSRQKALIQTMDYGSDFFLSARYQLDTSGSNHAPDLVYYFTITPENEALYSQGNAALIAYMKANSQSASIGIEKEVLKPGAIHFTITPTGTIGETTLTWSSGYPALDEKMMESISALPGKWSPASNEQGEKVPQTLVFFFGREGC